MQERRAIIRLLVRTPMEPDIYDGDLSTNGVNAFCLVPLNHPPAASDDDIDDS
jgi:hypothetical protein